ncbi:MAG: hypothetical protein PVI24_09705 [Myxococcales bacterium]|jgi:hypothetical protein
MGKELASQMSHQPTRHMEARARMARGWSLGLYIAGMAALGSGLLIGGIVAAAGSSAAAWVVAAVIGGTGVATGALGLWESRRFAARAKHLQRLASEHRLFALAETRGGTLRVVDVVRGLRLINAEAEALLDSLVDEVRVSMEVNDDGEIRYVFRELLDQERDRVRVRVEPPEPAEEPVPAADAAERDVSD